MGHRSKTWEVSSVIRGDDYLIDSSVDYAGHDSNMPPPMIWASISMNSMKNGRRTGLSSGSTERRTFSMQFSPGGTIHLGSKLTID